MGKMAARDSSCDLMGEAVIKNLILKLKSTKDHCQNSSPDSGLELKLKRSPTHVKRF